MRSLVVLLSPRGWHTTTYSSQTTLVLCASVGCLHWSEQLQTTHHLIVGTSDWQAHAYNYCTLMAKRVYLAFIEMSFLCATIQHCPIVFLEVVGLQ